MRKKVILLLILLIFIFAGCKKEENEKTYTVTFDVSTCTSYSGDTVIEVKSGTSIIFPKVYKEGYKFISWDNDLQNIKEDITLSPIFEKLKFSIKLFDGNTLYTTLTVEYGEKLKDLPYKEKEEDFDGYYYNNEKVNEATIVYSDMDLYGKYKGEKKEIEIKIDDLDENIDFDALSEIREKIKDLNINEITNINDFYSKERMYLDDIKEDEGYLSLWLDYIKKYDYDISSLSNTYLSVSNLLFNISNNVDKASIDPYKAIVSVCKAYLNKGVLNQYDQRRRCTGFSPYDATIYDTLYMDCSAFTDALYKYSLNGYSFLGNTAGICDYALNNQGKSDVIYYIDTTKIPDSQKDMLLLDIYNNLLPGDIIAYRHGKSSGNLGHAMIYLGDNLIIHSTGDDIGDISYDGNPDNYLEVQTDIEKTIGTVFTFSADDLFKNKDNKRYLFRKTAADTIYRFCIIRPLNKYKSLKEEAKDTYLLDDVDIYKESSASKRTLVNKNEEITFTIYLNNKSKKDIKYVPIIQDINDSYKVTDLNGGYIEGNKIIFNASLPKESKVKVSYKVKAKGDINTLKDGFTYVLSLSLPTINNTLAVDYEKEELENKINTCINKNYSAFYLFIKDIYSSFNSSYSSNLTKDDDIINISYKVYLYNSAYKRYLSNGFSMGDIITFKNSKTNINKKYLFFSENIMYTYENGKIKEIRGKENVQKILDTLYAQASVNVIRPLMKIN